MLQPIIRTSRNHRIQQWNIAISARQACKCRQWGSVPGRSVATASARWTGRNRYAPWHAPEELGCNFVDTAEVYGDSEAILGEFLAGRRDRWRIATKYSGQRGGLLALAERQLRHLGTDTIDFYQIHWVPRGPDELLYEDLYRLKKSGKARSVGVSLYTENDIYFVLDHTLIDGFQVCFSLLDPYPFLAQLEKIRAARPGIIIRSSLKSGLLTGKFARDATFPDPNDQRHQWSRRQIAKTVETVDQFRFLEQEAGSMLLAAARYPLFFPEVSTVLLSTKTVAQADINFGQVPGHPLSPKSLTRITTLQKQLRLGVPHPARRLLAGVKQVARQLLNRNK